MKIDRNIFVILTIVFLFSLCLNFFYLFKNFKNYFSKKTNRIEAVVKKIIDGDTFDTVDEERIRLYEVDAPELAKGCLAEEVKTRLEELILNKKISLQKIKKDNFGRTLAYVFDNDLLINKSLALEGLAYFEKGNIETEYSLLIEQSAEEAKNAGRGVWSSRCQTKKEECLIKGNYREADHTRIYHTPDCYNYDRITIKPGTTDLWFCTEEEARKAGFRKSNDCPR